MYINILCVCVYGCRTTTIDTKKKKKLYLPFFWPNTDSSFSVKKNGSNNNEKKVSLSPNTDKLTFNLLSNLPEKLYHEYLRL